MQCNAVALNKTVCKMQAPLNEKASNYTLPQFQMINIQ